MKLVATLDGKQHQLEVQSSQKQGQYQIKVDGVQFEVDARKLLSDVVTMIINGKSHDVDVEELNDKDPLDGRLALRVRGCMVYLEMLEVRRKKMKDAHAVHSTETGLMRICSPMPGKVVRVLVGVGDQVSEGQGLVVIEAMKMENELKAERAGTVQEMRVQQHQSVEGGALLMTIE